MYLGCCTKPNGIHHKERETKKDRERVEMVTKPDEGNKKNTTNEERRTFLTMDVCRGQG